MYLIVKNDHRVVARFDSRRDAIDAAEQLSDASPRAVYIVAKVSKKFWQEEVKATRTKRQEDV